MTTPLTIRQAWWRFLIDLELARHYPAAIPQFPVGMRRRNPVIDQLLPSLLHVKAVTILDAALKTTLTARGLKVPKTYGQGLQGRIDFLGDSGILAQRDQLQPIRETRNDVAHEFSGAVTWSQLDTDVVAIQTALEGLGLVPPRPTLEFFFERSAAEPSTVEGAACQFRYKFGLKDEHGEEIALVEWSETLMRVGR